MRKLFIFLIIIIFFSLCYTGYLYISGMTDLSSFKNNLDSELSSYINKDKGTIVNKVYEMAKSYNFILTKGEIEVKKGMRNRGTYISETFLKSAFPNQKSKYIVVKVKVKIPMFLFTKEETVKVSYEKPIIESPHKREIDKEMKNLPIF